MRERPGSSLPICTITTGGPGWRCLHASRRTQALNFGLSVSCNTTCAPRVPEVGGPDAHPPPHPPAVASADLHVSDLALCLTFPDVSAY